jgi:hypothetical protein
MKATNTKKSFVLASDLYRLGGGYSVQFTAGIVDGILLTHCVWHPTMPSTQELHRRVDMTLYAHALAQFTDDLVAVILDDRGCTQ